MTRRALGILLLLVALSPTVSIGEQATRVFHIGFLQPDAPDLLFDAFREGLRDLGYIEGKNIVIELMNEAGQIVIAYKVYRCWVSEYQALPELDANQTRVAIQFIRIENEGWERDTAVTEPKEPGY